MHTLIVSVNAKYEHENPAPWYLKAACDARNGACGRVEVLTGTINDPAGNLFAGIIRAMPDVVALSCYIWNRDMLLRLCADLRSAVPDLYLVVGGPEVSHADGGDDFLTAGVDAVLAGEGEERFPDLLSMLAANKLPDEDQRKAWRHVAPPLPPEQLFSPCLPEYLHILAGRIAYVEASRGCPYRCSYCLSSESTGLTVMPLPEVFAQVDALVTAGAKVIKFVDRTFNLSDDRTLAIWLHLAHYAGQPVTFHFEIAPDRLTEAQLSFLAKVPAGLFQVEAGIQSVHGETLRHIHRIMDVDKALTALQRLRAAGNVHVHADLIAGLPGEDPVKFADSFDRLSQANPHHLQLGFLKLLRGTRIRREAETWGYVARSYAPYEVLSSKSMTVHEMLLVKDVEETVERFRNSGRFLLVLQWLAARQESAFVLFSDLADLQRRQGMLGHAVSSDTLFRLMYLFVEQKESDATERGVATDLLRLDWVCAHRNPFLPDWLAPNASLSLEETNGIVLAYGEQTGMDVYAQGARKNFRNRFHAREVRVPSMVKEGIRIYTQPVADTPGSHRFFALVDTHSLHPALGRPEVVLIQTLQHGNPEV